MLWIYCAISALDILCYKCFGYIVLLCASLGGSHSIPRIRDIYVFLRDWVLTAGSFAIFHQYGNVCCVRCIYIYGHADFHVIQGIVKGRYYYNKNYCPISYILSILVPFVGSYHMC